MRPYRLATLAYACVSEQGTLFLDAEHNAYLGIDAQQARDLAPLVQGWPGSGDSPLSHSHDGHALAESLCERGVLARAPSGKDWQQIDLSCADAELVRWEHMTTCGLRPRHVLAFIWALLTALIVLKLRSFDTTVRRVQRRRDRMGSAFDADRARQLVGYYSTIRMFFFARRARCLLDSLALNEFLALYGIAPRWVVGVRTRPFAAHSWVQHDTWVLNGTPGFVRHFQPILAI